ncbi:MAG TPA: Glu/Leu/Phe/Val dehydrogenase [Candidatus Microsaccharimonas sp.]|nr:Glu/Leu/Phe/Val dehydrogenase [Candidatus Microsaccharimonas sp.]
MLETAHAFIDRAAEKLNIPTDVVAQLKQPNHEHVFEVQLDNGKSFKAFRVQHNNKLGPYKGGIRYHQNVTLEEVQTLATLMSLKTAAVGLPLGGGKGGITVNPRELSATELEELSRKYARHLTPHIGPDKDVPAPDVNTNGQIIDWMVEEYESITGESNKASFTGKSIAKGGSLGRDAATGRGGVLALAELLSLEDNLEKPLTYAVQGFGNVGSFFASTAQNMYPQWKLVAASDSEVAVHNAEGLDAKALQKFKEDGGRFKNYESDTEKITNDALLALDVDVLILAGLEDSVTDKNVSTVRAKHVVELANGPITDKALDAFADAGVTVLPDVIANAGGVIVSYLEWCQNVAGEHWTVEKVNDELAKYMKPAVKSTYEAAKEHGTDLKSAAFIIALKRLTA